MTQKKLEIGKPLTESDLLSFELPPVSEKVNDFIEADPEPGEPVIDSSIGQGFEQEAPDRVQATTGNEGAEAHRGRLSDSGEVYDPAIHAYPPAQTGKLKKWRKKSRKQLDQERGEQINGDNPAQDLGAEIRKSAENAAFLYGESHQLLYGDGGAIETTEDLLPLISAIERHMQQNGVKEIPPTLSVLVNAGFYTARVARREANKEKTKEIFGKIKTGFNWLLLKTGIRKKPAQSGDTKTRGSASNLNEPIIAGGSENAQSDSR